MTTGQDPDAALARRALPVVVDPDEGGEGPCLADLVDDHRDRQTDPGSTTVEYAKTISLAMGLDEALPKVKEAFREQGFGTLTEIDIRATLREKLGEEVEPYVILGACNPVLAHRALGITRDIGLLLPCNVVVREHGDGVLVQALDASIIASVPDLPELEPIAAEAGARIQAALDALEAG